MTGVQTCALPILQKYTHTHTYRQTRTRLPYRPNKKNNYNPPICKDDRVLYVPVGCGNCIECRNQKKREWQTRMNEEIKHDNTGQFITLTFSNEELEKLTEETGIKESNAVATLAVRRFLERWRKKYKKKRKTLVSNRVRTSRNRAYTLTRNIIHKRENRNNTGNLEIRDNMDWAIYQ